MKTIRRDLRRISNTQTLLMLVIYAFKKIPFALTLANNQTLIGSFAKFRLRIQAIIRDFANENPLYFNHLVISRLQHRLQICQLRSFTSLQVQAVSFAVCKEKAIENQCINLNFFASLFAKISNWK